MSGSIRPEHYDSLGEIPDEVQKAAIKAGQFDTAIGLLESTIMGGRETVRQALVGALTPDLTAKNATATHEALLTLSKCRNGQTRIITTNFDRLFEQVISNKHLSINQYQAPLLPVPKKRWDGLVYLHGMLSAKPSPKELHNLVISSGDFGLAYLTERWAARFVSELFRSYTVCFVGYSINDPVLRYMMDALAADRLLGETPPEMFAFGSYSRGQEEQRANEWSAKNVTPILYREHNRHSYLHNTLRTWAATYRDGAQGKERIVIDSAITLPLTSTKQDDFVGRILWALSDPKGLPAKQFAELNPVPSLDWLEPLSTNRYSHEDLDRFGVVSTKPTDNKLNFSLIQRPTPYKLAPLMTIADTGNTSPRWDGVMRQLARWLVRHLNDPKLILWLSNRGGKLHEDLIWLIESRLEELEKLNTEGNTIELALIQENAPNAIPEPSMRTLWQLLLSGRIKSWMSRSDIFHWRRRLKRDGLTASLRLELREVLAPRVAIREPFSWSDNRETSDQPRRIKDLVEWEVVLSSDHVHSSINDISKDEKWNDALPELLGDFTSLLRDTLDLMRELGGADEKRDRSYLNQPSISKHPQNKDYHDWTALIELCRESWLATARISVERACTEAETWWSIPFPVFRRLAFFAAAQQNIIPTAKALEWLLSDDGWWLWSVETEREAIRLLVAIAPRMNNTLLEQLEQVILSGPPRSMFGDDIEPERFRKTADREIWLRLAKLFDAGASLTISGKGTLDSLSADYPEWKLAEDQRDEFQFWVGRGDEWRRFVKTPLRRSDLVEWLKANQTDTWQEDDWRQRCSEDFSTTACALYSLSKEDIWPIDRWREALQVWSEDKLLKRSWRYIAQVVITAPDDTLKELAHSVSWWLQALAKTFDGQEELFLGLANRILSIDTEGGVDSSDPVMSAINHPVGHITQALLHWWYRTQLEDNQGLPEELRQVFTMLSQTNEEQYRHGRVLLATHAITLYRVAPDWSRQHLLPLFDWSTSEIEARSAWEGFLWSPRLYRPLLSEIKSSFLATAQHYDSLGKHDEQYASLITFAALDPGDTFTKAELSNAIRALPQAGLLRSAKSLVQALEGAGEKRAEYWSNRVTPFLRTIWPKTRDFASPSIAETLGHLCIAADEAFPDAFATLRVWLQPPEHPNYLVHRFQAAQLGSRFPLLSLQFLDLVISEQAQWIPRDLEDCLEQIITTDPTLEETEEYGRIHGYVRRRHQT